MNFKCNKKRKALKRLIELADSEIEESEQFRIFGVYDMSKKYNHMAQSTLNAIARIYKL